ncbi:galactokinase [Mycolicibacterium smegmatis]|uniref:Galactokinase n=2 Tax=Mycolicibacterium smegmatis TaxID=1772 RepID=A0QYK6_MYCS2|nr:galactokinase [Mycolicibacterium smegmatis]ABK74520.1 galactokinase [Mycolicibacterium smegmatis MC2 155]AIU08823.1 galactokinase [Mycolicibacterium smegmatis MC2 155]AIU15448.1 galactokinase [Mycolicibacterium smegmatis]AIU22071.1 galactokinase [Mycolicibacterium smegmatis]MBE9617957.1 galactokinase [Mycolicibacterium smegmatis]
MGDTVTYAAPGRINLIGEHTDYNLGLALPIALPQRVVVRYQPDDSEAITVSSAQESGDVVVPLDTTPGDITGWAAYIAGVVWALRDRGHRVEGGRMSITSDVEMGSGLASSAALECAVLSALTHGSDMDRVEQARIAQCAENVYVGAPTGLMDQLASLFGEPGRAMLIDFRELSVHQVPFTPETAGLTLLVMNSRAPHRHAAGEYAARRASCERVAAALGVESLREVQDRGLDALDAVTDDEDFRRARHILTENQRVLDVVAALEQSDFATAGEILTASHASMRDDFEITTAHIDLIADTAVRAGALGARLTGGGFGGCVIALVPEDLADSVAETVRSTVVAAGHPEPTISRAQAAPGAGIV